MKSIILKTFAAASLVAAAQAEVHVLGAVWKERGLSAPAGTIVQNPGTVASTRGYLIFDESLLTAAPGPGTLIQYRDIRSGGVIQRIYTIDSNFRAFSGDLIDGESGGRRIYGRIHAPNTIANVPGTVMPYTGSPNSDGYPVKLRFDDTVFQVGTATPLTGPQVVSLGATLARSVISGSASSVNVGSTTVSGATAELEDRLIKAGFTRGATAPVITTDLPASVGIVGGQTVVLSVGITNAFPTPIYQWFKDGIAIPAGNGGTQPTFSVVGADSTATNGVGVYRVEVTTSAGTAVSGNATVSGQPFTFATDLPETTPLVAASATTLSVVLSPNSVVTPAYQWFKGANPVPAAIGGTSPSLLVIGGEAATGAGAYRLEVTSLGVVSTSATTTVTVAAPGTGFVFTTNLPRTLAVPFAGTANLTPVVNTGSTPSSTTANTTRQWFKAPLDNPTAFEPIATGDGGNTIPLAVSGNNANVKGPGVYRLVVTSTITPTVSATTIDCVVTAAP